MPFKMQVRLTFAPAAGAVPLRVTVPVDESPPATLEGSRVRVASTAGVILRAPLTEAPLAEAVTFALVVALTPMVAPVKEANVLPAAMVTVAGTLRAVELEASLTESPPLAAGDPMEIVPVDESPPTTVVGLKVKDFNLALETVSLPLAELEPRVPVIFATVSIKTGEVEIANEAAAVPA